MATGGPVVAAARRFGISLPQWLCGSRARHPAVARLRAACALRRANPTVALSVVAVLISEAADLDAYDDMEPPTAGGLLFAAYQRRALSGADYWAHRFNRAGLLNNVSNEPQTANLNSSRKRSPWWCRSFGSMAVPLDSGMRDVQVATRGITRILI